MYAFTKPSRPITRIFLHCSASDNSIHDDVAVIRRWHLQRGWSDVGYHLFVQRSGTVQPGRSLELTPAAQEGHNSGTIAICLHGLLEARFSKEQLATLRRLCDEINDAYGGRVTFHGHREVNPRKTCPVYDYRAILGLDSVGRLGRVPQPSTDADDPVDVARTLRRGSTGDDVRWLQALLNRMTLHALVPDGVFGPRTESALKSFQQAHYLVSDGVFGPLTREVMDREIDELDRKAAA
jgi:hypothetical protein